MDSIKSLMEKNQFDLVLKLTENSTDVDSLFYRIGALLGLGRGEEALATVEKNQKLLQKRLAFLIRVHIDLLCILGRFDEAFEVLNYYRELPYESQEVEELLKEMPKYIREEEKSIYAHKNISDDDIRNRLTSFNSEEVLSAINLAAKRNIDSFFNEFQKVLTDFPHQLVRSFALMTLVERKINQKFKFLSVNGLIEVVPSKLTPPFIDNEFAELVKRMQNEFKNPSLSENAVSLLSSYIIMTYPNKMDLDEDYVVSALYFISNDLLDTKDMPNTMDYCLDHNLSIDKFNEIYHKLSDILTKVN